MLVHVVRLLGYAVQSVSVGAGNWFGAAGYSPSKGTYKRADVVLPHYLGPGRHMFLDTAVACLTAGVARSTGSAFLCGGLGSGGFVAGG